MSRTLSLLMAIGFVATWSPCARAGNGTAWRQTLRDTGQRTLAGAKTLGHRMANAGKSFAARIAPAQTALHTTFDNVKVQRQQDRLFKSFYNGIRAEPLGSSTARRAYWGQSVKRGVPLAAVAAFASGTLGVLSGIAGVLELSAGYLGDALILGGISAGSIWGAKRLGQAKRRGKAFARAELVASWAEAGRAVDQELTSALHGALSTYATADQQRAQAIEAQRAVEPGLLNGLKAAWARVKEPFAKAKAARSETALQRFEQALGGRAAAAE